VPSEATHRSEARANRALARSLLANNAGDPTALRWAATIAFYAAMHCMEAHLATRGLAGSNHKARKHLLRDPANGVPGHVYASYRRLEDAAFGARYLVRTFTPADVETLLSTQLATVTAFVNL
jgi:hypothetical protein